MNPKDDFVRDDGRIRFCDYNFARMNIFQWWWFEIRYWGYYKNELRHAIELLDCIAKGAIEFFVGIIFLPFIPVFMVFPVLPLIRGYRQIKRSQRELKRRNG